MRVLVLEDDPKIASFLEKGLTQSGFSVDVCEDGEEGLVRVTSTDYDAAIMDRMLPGMDGLEIIRRMRHNDVQTPVLSSVPRPVSTIGLKVFRLGEMII